MIRIMLIDHQRLVRTGLKALLSQERGIEVVSESANPDRAVAAAREVSPDVVLVNAELPGMGAQTANWALRPLSPRLAEYARNDTRFLLPLAERLGRRLDELGRREWLEQSCRRVVDAARVVRERDPETEWRVRGSHVLRPRAAAVLRALWRWREREAEAADRPPFHVLSNADLVDAAGRFERGERVAPRGLRGGRLARFGHAAEEALRLDEAEWPVRPPGRARPQFTRAQDRRLAALRGRRDRTAKELAIDADLVAPRAALERVAVEGDDALASLLPWQRSLLRG